MENPMVIGRDEYAALLYGESIKLSDKDFRASTKLVSSISESFEAGPVGKFNISKFISTDDGDRGGVVLRITLENEASSFFPYAVIVDNGIELHMAGDAEAKNLLVALRKIV
jgi:hypothetical protein